VIVLSPEKVQYAQLRRETALHGAL